MFVDIFEPFVVELFNRYLATGQYPGVVKYAFITPVIQRPKLDVADPGSYRPISNLAAMSQFIKHLLSTQLVLYLPIFTNLLPPLQLRFRPQHLTETAVIHVLSDIWRPLITETLPP